MGNNSTFVDSNNKQLALSILILEIRWFLLYNTRCSPAEFHYKPKLLEWTLSFDSRHHLSHICMFKLKVILIACIYFHWFPTLKYYPHNYYIGYSWRWTIHISYDLIDLKNVMSFLWSCNSVFQRLLDMGVLQLYQWWRWYSCHQNWRVWCPTLWLVEAH